MLGLRQQCTPSKLFFVAQLIRPVQTGCPPGFEVFKIGKRIAYWLVLIELKKGNCLVAI
jgi:hypothetical protein